MGQEPGKALLPDVQPIAFKDASGNVKEVTGRAAADGVAVPTGPELLALLLEFNGATYDRRRNNLEATALASAARTAETFSPDQVNYNARGLVVSFDVTAVPGADTVQCVIQGKSPLSGTYYNIILGATLSTVQERRMFLYPTALVAAQGISDVLNAVLPRIWRIRVVHSASTSFTYSVSYCYIV